MPSLLRKQNRCRVWGRHSPTRFHEGQNEQMAKFGPMVESCSTLPSLFVFCVFAKVSTWHFAVLLILPFYPNVVPARESHPGVAALMSSQSHISFRRSFNFEDVLSLWLVLDKQKEPITQSIRNRREHCSRVKVMFYVIGSEKSKSGSASYSSRQQNQRRSGAVRHFRCTDTVSDDPTNYVSIWSNISIQLLCSGVPLCHYYTDYVLYRQDCKAPSLYSELQRTKINGSKKVLFTC